MSSNDFQADLHRMDARRNWREEIIASEYIERTLQGTSANKIKMCMAFRNCCSQDTNLTIIVFTPQQKDSRGHSAEQDALKSERERERATATGQNNEKMRRNLLHRGRRTISLLTAPSYCTGHESLDPEADPDRIFHMFTDRERSHPYT